MSRTTNNNDRKSNFGHKELETDIIKVLNNFEKD